MQVALTSSFFLYIEVDPLLSSEKSRRPNNPRHNRTACIPCHSNVSHDIESNKSQSATRKSGSTFVFARDNWLKLNTTVS